MTPAEREAGTRDRLLAEFDKLCPGVVGNPYIPHWPLPAQAALLGLHQGGQEDGKVTEALYGGSAGGGKSDALLMAAAQYVSDPEYAGICFRRTITDLEQPGALLDRAMAWWMPQGVHWNGRSRIFTFPTGAKVAFAYLSKPNDHLRYQGAEYQFTGWDELTQFPDAAPYKYVGISRVRRKDGSRLPLRTYSASNPGGPGHDWVRTRFMGGVHPETGAPIVAEHPYIPARIRDNPYIDQDAYIAGLMDLHPTVREQLLNGDWSAREPGDYFRAEWFGPLIPPEQIWAMSDCIRVRWWDLAASEKESAAKTAGVRVARHRSGVRAVEHCRAFRATPGKRDDLIVQTAQADGPSVVVGLEIEPGSGGIAQFHALETRLKAQGFRVVGARPKVLHGDKENQLVIRATGAMAGKQGRADPVASCLERGYQRRGEGPRTAAPWWGVDATKPVAEQADGLRLVSGPWTSDFLSIVEGFPDGATCDEVDALSGAWAYLEAHPFGLRVPGNRPRPAAVASAESHPDDRPHPDKKAWRKA